MTTGHKRRRRWLGELLTSAAAPPFETGAGGRWDQGPFGGKKIFYIERTVDFTKFEMSTAP
jgi:hypothetical protein